MLFSLPDFTFLQGTISDQTGAFNIKSNESLNQLRSEVNANNSKSNIQNNTLQESQNK